MKRKKPSKLVAKSPIKKSPGKQVSSDDLPRKTLEDALKVAIVIKDTYAGKLATWEDIAKGMEFSANNPNNRYYLWAALAYGLIAKDENENYRITETGRKILAPTYEGEEREGTIKAIASPSILARFYSDYSASLLPSGDIFKNVLEQKYGVPANRVDEAINLILANARYAKLIQEQPDGRLRLISGNAAIGVGGPESGPRANHSEVEAAGTASADTASVDFGKSCFIITPIGDEGSPERKHADALLRHLITPILDELKILPIRADKIAKPGHITKQVVEHIAYCKLCITDLSFGNQNAHYELGIRHALKLPSIQIIRKGDKIPFDVQQGRTIIIDTADPYTIMDRVASARAELIEHLRALLDPTGKHDDSPISMYLPNLTVRIG